ncbi:MAG: hypothetical protein M3Q46_09525 [Verrucomicrobiota bacterium]|nr:hypothetical protein [Verrucomicrobiota bacterium]
MKASGSLPSSWFIVRRILAVLVGALFVYAGVVKLLDPLHFATEIDNYHLVSWPIAVRLAFYLPWLELLAGLALILHRLFDGAVALTTALMLGFIGASIVAKARGIDVSCGCFGTLSDSLSFTWHLVLDFVLLAILLFLWFRPRPAPLSA